MTAVVVGLGSRSAPPHAVRSGRRRVGHQRASSVRHAVTVLTAVAGIAAVVAALCGVRAVSVLTGSMGRAVPAGSLTLTTRLPPADVRVGDVIAFRPPARYGLGDRAVVHRVARVEQAGGQAVLRTRGDMNPALDPWAIRLDGADLGRVRGSAPWLGRATAAGPFGVLAMLVGGACLSAAIRRRRRECTC